MGVALGINAAFHEDAATLVVDGQLVAAIEEERLTRRKHGKRASLYGPRTLPFRAIDAVLDHAGIEAEDVDWIGYSFDPAKRLLGSSQLTYPYTLTPGSWGTRTGELAFFRALNHSTTALGERYGAAFAERLAFLDHHLCHAASAFLVSPFDEAAVLVLDGIGETACITLARGFGDRIEVIETTEFPVSLGLFWERVTELCGFDSYNASYLMGLAPYGERNDELVRLLSALVPIEGNSLSARDEILTLRRFDQERERDGLAALESYLGVERCEREADPMTGPYPDIAWAAQHLLEARIQLLARRLWDIVPTDALCLAGGVALNCVANGRLLEATPFERLWVQPAANDAGTALGAAILLHHALDPTDGRDVMSHAYLGPSGLDRPIADTLRIYGLDWQVPGDLCGTVAAALADGDVVGWFQGRMEFGPRALGNRSLLADPRRREMRNMLNEKVKHREPFRPFCPSVLAEDAGEWFEVPSRATAATDFMLYACQANAKCAELAPAIVHVDGTARIQTVRTEHNQVFSELLRVFKARTGVPMLLNTSFNDSEPIVCSLDDAIRTFLSTEIDCLVVGGLMASKPGRHVERGQQRHHEPGGDGGRLGPA